MDTRSPRVSIGLPVYNGDKYLNEAIETILAQTYEDFELIISDNASTDQTAEICRRYAAKDKRIKYYRNNENLGLQKNLNRLVELSSGEYFMWAHHDDIHSSDFVDKAIKVLQENPSVVLCCSKTRDIDENGKLLPRIEVSLNFKSPHVEERFCDLIRMDHLCEPLFGLIRIDILRRTGLNGSFADADRVLLAELSFYGPFHQIPEFLFYRRSHSLQSTAMFPSRQERTIFYDPTKVGKIVFPHFREFVEYLHVVNRAAIKWPDRLACYLHLMKWAKVNYARLASDISFGMKQLLMPCWRLIKNG